MVIFVNVNREKKIRRSWEGALSIRGQIYKWQSLSVPIKNNFFAIFLNVRASSDDEPMPTSLASFFAPADSGESSSAANLTSGSIAADGDLDSRLANILNSSAPGSQPAVTESERPAVSDEKPKRKSRWDSDDKQEESAQPAAANGDFPPPPPIPPAQDWIPPPPQQQWPTNQPPNHSQGYETG